MANDGAHMAQRACTPLNWSQLVEGNARAKQHTEPKHE